MEGLVNEGQQIDNVVSVKIQIQYQPEARKLAMKVKLKSEEILSVLGQKEAKLTLPTIHKTINHSLLCKDEDNRDG
jgi:hypothetical protein